MKRVVEAFHVAKGSEKAVGLIQVVLVIAIVAGTIGITKVLRLAGDTGPGYSSRQAGLVVDVLMPQATSHQPTVFLTGTVSARAPVSISPQVSGRVAIISEKLEPGARLAAGDTLFEIEKRDFELALERAEADVAAAKAELVQTEATAENFIKDWHRVFPDRPAPALVAKEPQVQALKAKLKAAEAGLAQARLNLDRTQYRVPFPARVVTTSIERGQLVSAGGQYGTVYATDSLRITAGIDPKDAARLALTPGDQAAIVSETGQAAALSAPVTQVGGVLDSKTRLQDIVIALPEDAGLVPGTFANVTLSGRTAETVFRLPVRVLATSSSVWTVSGDRLLEAAIDMVDMDRDHIYVRPFDVADGIVVSEVPTSFVDRTVSIRKRLDAGGQP